MPSNQDETKDDKTSRQCDHSENVHHDRHLPLRIHRVKRAAAISAAETKSSLTHPRVLFDRASVWNGLRSWASLESLCSSESLGRFASPRHRS
jgi:hypothetical protein